MALSNTNDNSQTELHEWPQEVQSFAQNFEPSKTEQLFSVDKKPNKEIWKKMLEQVKTLIICASHFTSIWKDDTNSKTTIFKCICI